MKKYRKNDEIRSPIVKVIIAGVEDNEMLGDMPIAQALEEAQKREKDLVEISPTAKPPVCKVMDYGQFLYQQKKAEQKSKKNQKQTVVKTIRIGFRIGEHDIEVREKQTRKFLEEGALVRVVMQFKGREMSHIDFGLDKIKHFAEILEDIATIEQPAKRQGNQVVMVLTKKK